MPVNVTMRQLYAFSYVARYGTFTQAGTHLHLTQAAISALVKELESTLGVQLLARSTRSVALTEIGSAFLERVTRNLGDLEDAVDTIDQLRALKQGRVTIAATQLIACTVVPDAVSTYQKLHPAIDVRIVDLLAEEASEQVRRGEVDLGVGPERMRSPDLVAEPFVEVPTMLVCPVDHPLARVRRLTWAKALEYPYIALKGNFTTVLARDLMATATQIELRPKVEVAYFTTIMGMVRAGGGITSAPEYALPIAKSFGLTMRPLSQPYVLRQFYIFTNAERPLTPAADSFHRFLREFRKSLASSRTKRDGQR